MSIDLVGKRALVTGSTSGMGYAIARRLAAAGAAVVVHGRTADHVRAACSRLTSDVREAEVSGHAADLADHEAVQALVAAVPSVDILVTGAGPTEGKPFFDLTDEDWRRYIDIYIMSTVCLTRHYLREMMSRGWGRILLSAAVVDGLTPGEGNTMTHWGTCKAALLGLSRGLAECATGTGVTVNAFLPGPTHTEESFMSRARPAPGRRFAEIERQLFDGPLSTSIIRRFEHPDEVAAVVAFLASNDASAVTGTAFRVDGGIVRSIV